MKPVLTKGKALVLLVTASLQAGLSLAQLSPPIADGVAMGGTGPGVHSPNSPFAPLPQRNDVLPWSMLTDVKTRAQGSVKGKGVSNRLLPVFPAPVQALNDKTLRIQGFMMPLEPGEKHKHFILSSVPMSCSFCIPGGPESMVEVKTKTPVKFSLEPVIVEGKFAVLADDPFGLFYRVTDAVSVK